MKKIIIISLVLLWANCKPKNVEMTTANQPENIRRIWMLVEFSNFEKNFLIDNKAQLNLTNSNLATAQMGCNSFTFESKITSSEIIFSKGIMTQMACNDMKLEDEFSKKIDAFTKYKIEGNRLVLSTPKNEKMVFIAQDWD